MAISDLEKTETAPVLCEICQSSQFKYKCSKCLLKYCSIPCLNKHKDKDNCSNRLYDPLEYVSNKDIKSLDDEKKSNNLIVKRDYEYLMGMDRIISVSKFDFSQKNKYLNNYNSNIYNNRTINKFLTESGMELRFIMQRGCRCFLLPEGSSVHKRNKSRYDNKLKKFQWTLNWNVKSDSDDCDPQLFTLDKCFEDFKLVDIITRKWSKDVFKKNFQLVESVPDSNITLQYKEEVVLDYVSRNKIQMYLKHYPNKMSNLLDTTKAVLVKNLSTTTLSELLVGKTCLEYPTIFVKIIHGEPDVNEIFSGREEVFYKEKLAVYASESELESCQEVVESEPQESEAGGLNKAAPNEAKELVVSENERAFEGRKDYPEIKVPEGIKDHLEVKPLEGSKDHPEVKPVEGNTDHLELNSLDGNTNQPKLKRDLQEANTPALKKAKFSDTLSNINNHLPKSIPDLYEKTDSESEGEADAPASQRQQTVASNSLAARLFG